MTQKTQFWELHFIRGIAILLMILFHILWNIDHFLKHDINLITGPWNVLQVTTASLFLLLVGITITLSRKKSFPKYFKRGFKILSWGLLITVLTSVIIPSSYIRFGILHLIGVSIWLGFVMRKFIYTNLLIGIVIIISQYFLPTVKQNWFVPLGLYANTFHSVDYYPLVPWFGVVLIGIFLGNKFYSNHKRQFPLATEPNSVKPIIFLGKHSLTIYLTHQAILFILFYIAAKLLYS